MSEAGGSTSGSTAGEVEQSGEAALCLTRL